jgi:L-alanine-DL-glutamate epimerase-like enolase superfamily enzyme
MNNVVSSAQATHDRIDWIQLSLALLPLAKLLGAQRDSVLCYNTSGGFLSSPLAEVLKNVEINLERGVKGVKLKVGQPDPMLDYQRVSVAEHWELIRHKSVDFIQPDAPRVGGITQMLKIMALAEHARLRMAPHFAMEIHLHLCASCAHEPWVEHFEWLEPLFNGRLTIEDGRMQVPARHGLGFSLSEQARRWTAQKAEFGQRP